MMYLAYSYPLGQPAIPALGAHTPIATADYSHPQYVTAVTAPSIAEPYLVPVTAAHQPLQAAPAPYQALTLAVCRKRGSEELMSHSPMVQTNGTGHSPSQNEVNDAKKVKLDSTNMMPSKVIHLRSLPNDVTDSEVVQLGIPFGKMSNVLLLKQKNQAFLEFEDEGVAATFVNYYTKMPCQIRGKQVYVQFSQHKELKTDQAHSFQNQASQAALQAAQLALGNGGDGEGIKKTVLRVIVENLVYPVTIEVLNQIFSKFGKVLKMIIFTKNNTFQALVQFGDSVSANAAKLSLDGQNIYNGCCTLRIDYSKLGQLNVRYNNDKSRDFTNPSLPTGDPGLDQAMAFGGGGRRGSDVSMTGDGPSSLLGAGPGPQGMGGMGGMAGMGGMGMQGLQFGFQNPMAGRLSLAGMQQQQQQSASAVILVSNLDEQVTPEALFTLFGVYGDVHRVKILFNKKDNALIQMAEAHQAQLAIAHLDKVKVWGKQIRVTQSKHSLVQMPKDGQPDAGLTKDFTNSQLHRFKRPGSKNCQNIFPPSAVLHLSNIPPTVTEEELTEQFTHHGEVKAFKFFQKDRRMALIEMSSVEEAIIALIAMHNFGLSDTNHLRVSFSKSTI
ncbi:polypyrimidine tract-binding protein 3-like isoform X14 [Dreissena polymorpha]|uniref:polypyrimidine tract-binding protein 3-like isoform X14 n=1 Tax=Dreissena polymorpha TaxID=45954 RepID=UPI00226546C8|nr:polypyrimidine tract-binding protein 3-like isoform X14 [Dreissena polymorpha]